jgi:Zn-dependent protease
MKCQACNQETTLPFTCPHCGGQFCSVHRLPENHACPKLNEARTQHQQQVMNPQTYGSYSYSYVYGKDPYKRQYRVRFSQKELKHVLIAAALVVGIGFSMALYGFWWWTWDVMAVFAAAMTVSFLAHEMGHKVFAQKAGMWAEFRLTTWGAVLTLASVFLPFKMIAPGAMMIGGSMPSAKDMMKISIAGVIINLAFSGLFLGLAFAMPFNAAFFVMFLFSAYINAFMAVFNLIPFGVLDGYKIFSLNKAVWAAAFVPAVILTIATYLYMVSFL